ncbi:hypothetical protein LTR37_019961 [Vermiconidia calcicola]|uniref:Uncharacterized protein n=1 Tax=Vermiconidia calcicola TaxID=1690605 RepID=A0ACC3MCM0_9PEZI|nr:hypothetical protein LTR37_019961 [Vermiconidia calcicola]
MANTQQFDFETMAVVLYAMAESGVSLGMKHYEMMSAVDGTRGKDSFNHQFRKVKARAKELQEQAKDGGVGTPVKKTKSPAGAKTTDKQAGSGRKRAQKAKAEVQGEGSDDEESPSKKVKTEYHEDGDDRARGLDEGSEADAPGEDVLG